MALTTVRLGAELDIATGDEVRDAIGDSEGRILGALNRPSRYRGSRKRLMASDPIPAAATGTFILDFGSPMPNYLWWIVEVQFNTGDDHTAAAGAQGTLYAGTMPYHLTPTTISPVGLGYLIRPAIASPGVFTFARDAFPVYASEELFAVIYSPTTAVSNVNGVATVFELPESAVLFDRL